MKLPKLIEYGFCMNHWGWFHCLAGGVLALLFGLFLSAVWTIIAVLICAVIWELIEFFVGCKGDRERVKKTYGSIERYWYDSSGDIILAVACAILVELGRL